MAQNLPLQFIVKTALTALLGFNASVFGQRLLSANLKPQNENQVSCGAPGYLCSYVGSDVRQLPTVIPSVGGWNSNDTVVYDTSFPSANRNPIIRCTDAFTETSHPYFSFAGGQGGSGDVGSLVNTNSTALHVNDQGGRGFLLAFNPNPASPSCGAIYTHGGQQWNVSAGMFSKTDPTLWYSYGATQDSVTTNTQINTYRLNQTNGTVALIPNSTVADFIYAIGSMAPAWQKNTHYHYGDMVTFTLPNQPAWSANNSSLCTTTLSTVACTNNVGTCNQGSIVAPKNNNPSHRAFACVIAGATGAREPNWQHFYNGNASDGAAAWSDIGAPPTFVFQVTSEAGGTSGSSAPVFPAGLLYTVMDNGLTWTNVGVAETATWASSAGGVSVDGTKFTSGYSTNNYSSPGGQNSGLFATAYDATANVYHLFNTGTGIATDFVCRGGTGYNCAGGGFLPSTVGTTSLGPDSDLYYIHNVKASEDGKFVVIAGENCINNANCAYVYHIWQPAKGIVKGINPPCAGHWTRGYKKFACEGKAGLKSGTYFTLRSLNDPGNGAGNTPPNPVWMETPCGGNGEPACTPAFDGHWNWAKNDGTDTTPIFGSTYNVKQFPYNSAYQNEVVGFTTVAPFKQWRFTHTFATATNDNFNAQYVVGQAFQQGDFYAWTSDWGATLGTNDGSSPIFPVPPYPSTANCLGGFPWLPKTTYSLGTMIHPVSGYTTFGVYQLVAILGGGQSSKSGSSTPSWLFGTPRNMGTQVTDDSQIWQNLGQGNCRGDLFVVSLR